MENFAILTSWSSLQVLETVDFTAFNASTDKEVVSVVFDIFSSKSIIHTDVFSFIFMPAFQAVLLVFYLLTCINLVLILIDLAFIY